MKRNQTIHKLWSAVRLFSTIVFLVVALSGCRSTRPFGQSPHRHLSSKVELTVPSKQSAITVGGSMKLISGERIQLSFLMPLLRTEVARIEATPGELLLVDRMGKRYVRATRKELRGILPRKADFEHLEKMLFTAAKPNGKRVLTARELGIPAIQQGRIELYDFSDRPFQLQPTQLSNRYKEVPLEELLYLLMSLTRN